MFKCPSSKSHLIYNNRQLMRDTINGPCLKAMVQERRKTGSGNGALGMTRNVLMNAPHAQNNNILKNSHDESFRARMEGGSSGQAPTHVCFLKSIISKA